MLRSEIYSIEQIGRSPALQKDSRAVCREALWRPGPWLTTMPPRLAQSLLLCSVNKYVRVLVEVRAERIAEQSPKALGKAFELSRKE